MAVLMIASIAGDPDDLAERYRRQQPLVRETFGGPPPGYLAHVCARSDEGLVVTNLVDSDERVWETRPRFAETAHAVGLPEPAIRVHPVINALSQELAPTIV